MTLVHDSIITWCIQLFDYICGTNVRTINWCFYESRIFIFVLQFCTLKNDWIRRETVNIVRISYKNILFISMWLIWCQKLHTISCWPKYALHYSTQTYSHLSLAAFWTWIMNVLQHKRSTRKLHRLNAKILASLVWPAFQLNSFLCYIHMCKTAQHFKEMSLLYKYSFAHKDRARVGTEPNFNHLNVHFYLIV